MNLRILFVSSLGPTFSNFQWPTCQQEVENCRPREAYLFYLVLRSECVTWSHAVISPLGA